MKRKDLQARQGVKAWDPFDPRNNEDGEKTGGNDFSRLSRKMAGSGAKKNELRESHANAGKMWKCHPENPFVVKSTPLWSDQLLREDHETLFNARFREICVTHRNTTSFSLNRVENLWPSLLISSNREIWIHNKIDLLLHVFTSAFRPHQP